MNTNPVLTLTDVSKSFTMHLRGGILLPVFENVAFKVQAGECVVLTGPSGIGKSSILKMIYGNYRTHKGSIVVRSPESETDIVAASAREIMALRRNTIGYISQFLRVIPRVSALDIVAGAAIEQGREKSEAQTAAESVLSRLNVPEKLWHLPPATFSGGEQQRVNIARGFVAEYPILLLDEPTASLDAANRAVVIELIEEKKAVGCAIVGIFHDADVRDEVADRTIDVTEYSVSTAA
ncbi:MAG: phosphonate C-P lyase system protein PhnL [Pseudomonadota bacterium]